VVRLEDQPDAPVQPERLDESPRELEPADSVEDGVLLGDDVVVAGIGECSPASATAAE